MRGRGLKIKGGRDERQSNRKHCKEPPRVRSTLGSILLPTSIQGQLQHGRTGDWSDQYGLLEICDLRLQPDKVLSSPVLPVELPEEVAGLSGQTRQRTRLA